MMIGERIIAAVCHNVGFAKNAVITESCSGIKCQQRRSFVDYIVWPHFLLFLGNSYCRWCLQLVDAFMMSVLVEIHHEVETTKLSDLAFRAHHLWLRQNVFLKVFFCAFVFFVACVDTSEKRR